MMTARQGKSQEAWQVSTQKPLAFRHYLFFCNERLFSSGSGCRPFRLQL